MMQGYLHSQEQIRQTKRQREHDVLLRQQYDRQNALTQAQIKNYEVDKARAEQEAAVARLNQFLQHAGEAVDLSGLAEPDASQVTSLGQAYGVPESAVTAFTATIPARVSRGVKADAMALLDRIKKHVPEAGQTDESLSLEWAGHPERLQKALLAAGHPNEVDPETGQDTGRPAPIKPSEVRRLLGIGVNPSTGQPWQPEASSKVKEGSFPDYLNATPEEQARIEAAKTRYEAAGRPPHDTGPAERSRLDRSYQYNNALLDKSRTPLQAQGERISRLVESLNQRTPAADALVAPELLTAMAGGMGSGLRMNEAEIARIVGGRSSWETLKATLNKWQADPSKALSITDSQREQMRALVNAMQARIQAKLTALNDASQALIDAPDVTRHRAIVSRANQRLQTVDREGVPIENDQTRRQPIPGIPGGEAEWRDGKWIRVK